MRPDASLRLRLYGTFTLETAVPVTAVLSAALGAGLLAGTSPDADAAPAKALLGSAAKTVTLVTGDKVVVDARGRVTAVKAGDGRKGTGFRFKQTSGHSYVLPNDAEPLIANGIVDQRLFDVTQLLRSRYDDARRSEVPLIVTYDKGTSIPASSLRSSGATVQRNLPSVNGDALRARKSEASALWETLTRAEGGGEGQEDLAGRQGQGDPAQMRPRLRAAAPLRRRPVRSVRRPSAAHRAAMSWPSI
ncbi:hypothetical protein [Streptomyces werraensis]|uniref:hypothetical protein n=1 Tax=Streptomyces werraensis TaxID=68284 RepID=UPI001CE3431D